MRTDNHRKCTCGSWDCFEIYASGKGLELTAEEITNKPNITTYDVIEGVNAKDEQMLKIFNQWQNDITNGIIGLANIFDPDCFVLSGSMAEFTDTEKIERIVNSQIVTTPTKVIKASAGNYSGMIGAALLALN
jgi:glucokinase